MVCLFIELCYYRLSSAWVIIPSLYCFLTKFTALRKLTPFVPIVFWIHLPITFVSSLTPVIQCQHISKSDQFCWPPFSVLLFSSSFHSYISVCSLPPSLLLFFFSNYFVVFVLINKLLLICSLYHFCYPVCFIIPHSKVWPIPLNFSTNQNFYH